MKFKCISLITASLLVTISFTGCGNSNTKEKVAEPVGLGYEQTVLEPSVSYPLPSVDNIETNDSASGQDIDGIDFKRSINKNSIANILKGINNIWKETTDEYQNASSGNGPNPFTDLVDTNPIIDEDTWRKNIEYVVQVTNNRTEDQTILAFLDDVRSKNYSVLDGFGPLTEEYVAEANPTINIAVPTLQQVLENQNFNSDADDDTSFGGDTNDNNKTLDNLIQIARETRGVGSSASNSKYIFATPRPWRMTNTGTMNFKGTTIIQDDAGEYTGSNGTKYSGTYECTDTNGSTSLKVFDIYESGVKVVPGLMCKRRAHSTSKEGTVEQVTSGEKLYSADTSNRRKDGGYPSGHTNAGVLSSIGYAYGFPIRFTELVFRGSQLGEDRILAGMHSPVDVIGGRIMGLSIASALLNKQSNIEIGENAVKESLEYFGEKAKNAGMSLYEYSHRKVENVKGYKNGGNVRTTVFDNNYYDNYASNKEIYKFRMTYGFTQDTTKAGQAPIVPKGAEALLRTRFPYLSAEQRRAVLATTEIDSGYPLLDESNGWGRINLFDAGSGYGAFEADVTVKMDAELGGLNAEDRWQNDISGNGLLSKEGTGKLILTGNNSYTGGTVINEGTLEASSSKAFGNGDIYMKNGNIIVNEELIVTGNYSQSEGNLQLNINSTKQGKLNVSKTVNIENGSLLINFNDYSPKSGDSFEVISANKIIGKFSNIIVEGYSITHEQTSNKLIITIK